MLNTRLWMSELMGGWRWRTLNPSNDYLLYFTVDQLSVGMFLLWASIIIYSVQTESRWSVTRRKYLSTVSSSSSSLTSSSSCFVIIHDSRCSVTVQKPVNKEMSYWKQRLSVFIRRPQQVDSVRMFTKYFGLFVVVVVVDESESSSWWSWVTLSVFLSNTVHHLPSLPSAPLLVSHSDGMLENHCLLCAVVAMATCCDSNPRQHQTNNCRWTASFPFIEPTCCRPAAAEHEQLVTVWRSTGTNNNPSIIVNDFTWSAEQQHEQTRGERMNEGGTEEKPYEEDSHLWWGWRFSVLRWPHSLNWSIPSSTFS